MLVGKGPLSHKRDSPKAYVCVMFEGIMYKHILLVSVQRILLMQGRPIKLMHFIVLETLQGNGYQDGDL